MTCFPWIVGSESCDSNTVIYASTKTRICFVFSSYDIAAGFTEGESYQLD